MLADIFDQVAAPSAPAASGGDIFDQVAATPSASTPSTPEPDYSHPAGISGPAPSLPAQQARLPPELNPSTGAVDRIAQQQQNMHDPLSAASRDISGGIEDVYGAAKQDFEHSHGNPFSAPLTGDAAKQNRDKALGGAAKLIAGGGTVLMGLEAPAVLQVASKAIGGDLAAKLAIAKIAASVGAGAGASAGAGAVADKYNVSPGAKNLIQAVSFFVPSLMGIVSGVKTGIGTDVEGNPAAGASAFGGKVRAGAVATPEAYDIRAAVGDTKVGVKIPRSQPAPPPPDPSQVLNAEQSDAATNTLVRAATKAQQASQMVAGGPPPPPPGPTMPDGMKNGVISQQIVHDIAAAISIAPPEQHPQLLMEAHGKLTEYIQKQGRIIGPDGKLAIAETPQQAAKLAQNIINDEVDRQSQAKEDAATAQADAIEQQKKDATAPAEDGGLSPVDMQWERAKTLINSTTLPPGKTMQSVLQRNIGVGPDTADQMIDRHAKETAEAALPTIGSKKEPVVEESRATVDAQVEALKRGDTNVVMIPDGAKYRPAAPAGMKLIAVRGDAPGAGFYIYNPKEIKAATIKDAAKAGTHGDLLGHIQPKSELAAAPEKPTVVVQAQDKDGTPIQDSEVHPERAPQQIEAMQERHPDAKVVVKPTHEVIADRVAAQEPEEKETGGDIFDQVSNEVAPKEENKEGELSEKIPEQGAGEGSGANEPSPAPNTPSLNIEKEEFGTVHEQFHHDAKGAIERLVADRTGEAVGALHHPEVGDIDLVYGKEGTSAKDYEDGYGLAKIAKKHPEVLSDLQGFVDGLHVASRSDNRIVLSDPKGRAIVRLSWDGKQKKWLLTAYVHEKTASAAESGRTAVTHRAESTPPVNQVADVVTSVPKITKGDDITFKDRNGRERTGTVAHAGDRIMRIKSDGKEYTVAAKKVSKTSNDVDKKEAEIKPGDVGRMEVSDLHLDPKRFQYKVSVGAEGVSDLLTGKKWNDNLAGVTSVWRDPADGKTYVVNGHHRATLAKQTKTETIPVRMLDAKDAGEARSFGALQNIAEGRGTAIDAAKFFRDTKITPVDLDKEGISLGEATAQNGLALANLDDRLFDMVAQGKLGQGRGIAIGRETSDPATQDAILKLIEKSGDKITDAALGELARFAQTAPLRHERVASLFGDEDRTTSTALDKAQVSAYVLRELGAEKRAFGAVSSESRAKKLAAEGKNRIDVAGNTEKATGAEQAREVYLKLSARRGPIDDILNRAAEERSNARPSQVAAIDQRAYDDIRAAVSETFAGGKEASAEATEESSPPDGQRAELTLPGMEDDVARQEESAVEVKAEVEKQDVEASLTTPKDNIDKAAGEMERNSPLFRDSEASSQGGLFGNSPQLPTDTPAFKRWFSDSKIVDKDGKPLVVYHGTDRDFDEFKRGSGVNNVTVFPGGEGHYFTKHAEDASNYAETGKGSPRVLPVYLSIQKPMYIEKGFKHAYIPPEEMAEYKAAGHDGIVYRDGEEIVAFEANQIKSAIGNSGAFDPNEVSYLHGGLGFTAGALKPLADIKPVADAIAFLGDEADRVAVSRDIHNRLYDLASQDNAAVLRTVQMLKAMPGTAKDQQAIYHHLEDPKSVTLTPEQEDILDNHLTPLIYQAEHDFQVVSEGGVPLENYVHRQVRDRGGMIDRIMEKVRDKTPSNGIGGGRLTKTAPAQKHRTMMAIEDAKTGKRQVVSIKGGRVALMKNGQPPQDIGGLRNGLTTVGAEVDDRMAPFVKRVTDIREEIAGAKDADRDEQLADVQGRIADLRKQMDTLLGVKTRAGQSNPDMFDKGGKLQYSRETTFNQRAEITKKLDPLLKREELLKNGIAPMLAKNANKLMRAKAELKGAEAFRDAALNELPPETFADKAWKDKNGTLHKITQATTKEIEANTNVRYYQNAAASVAVNYLAMDKARRAYEFLEDFKKSPEFAVGSHSINSPGAIPKGWKATQLPQFRGYFFEPHIAEVLDAYAAKAAHDPSVLEKVGNFMRASIFFNPLIHIPNLLNHWTVEKGISGFANPANYPTITRAGIKAINAVIHQNKDFLEALDHGAPLQSQQFETKQFADLFFKKMQDELGDPESSKAKELATAIGMSPVRLVKAIYDFSGKATWYTNDVAFLQSTYEKQERGMSLKDALTETAKHIPDYRLMTRIFDNPRLAKLMSNPNITMFGAYHYGALKSYGQMAKSLTGFNWTDAGTKNEQGEPTNAAGRTESEEKLHGLDTLAMVALVTFVVYPLIDKLLQEFTGNKKAQMRRAGASTFIYNLAMMAKGEKTPEEFTESIATPAVQTKALAEMALNRDLRTGQRIYDPHAPAKKLASQVGRQLARSLAPVSQGMDVAEGRTDMKRLMYSMVGVSFPLHGAEKIAAQITAERLSSLPPRDEDEIAHAIQRSRALHDAWAGDRTKLNTLLHGKDFTAKEKAKIRRDVLLPPIVYAVRGMTYDDAVKVYHAADAQQRHQLRPLMTKKLDRLLKEGRKPEEILGKDNDN